VRRRPRRCERRARNTSRIPEWGGQDYYCDSCKGGAIYPDREDVARDLRALSIADTCIALTAAVEAARDEGRIEGATLAAAELAAAVEAARREGVEQAARWHDDRAVARRHAGLDQAADEHRAYAAAIRARSGGKEGA
jgi:hypothetical protein